jgi:hypothetical protein
MCVDVFCVLFVPSQTWDEIKISGEVSSKRVPWSRSCFF